MRAPRTTLAALAATLVSATLVGPAGPAAAATRGDWATWPATLVGSAGDYATTVTLPGVGGPTTFGAAGALLSRWYVVDAGALRLPAGSLARIARV